MKKRGSIIGHQIARTKALIAYLQQQVTANQERLDLLQRLEINERQKALPVNAPIRKLISRKRT